MTLNKRLENNKRQLLTVAVAQLPFFKNSLVKQ